MQDGDGGALKVAMLGCGVVGSEVARLFTEQAADLAARVGRPLEFAGIAVRRPGRARGNVGVGDPTGDSNGALVDKPPEAPESGSVISFKPWTHERARQSVAVSHSSVVAPARK